MQSLKALEAYQLMFGLAQQLADADNCVNALCQSASILLDMGASELAKVNAGINCKHILSLDFHNFIFM